VFTGSVVCYIANHIIISYGKTQTKQITQKAKLHITYYSFYFKMRQL